MAKETNNKSTNTKSTNKNTKATVNKNTKTTNKNSKVSNKDTKSQNEKTKAKEEITVEKSKNEKIENIEKKAKKETIKIKKNNTSLKDKLLKLNDNWKSIISFIMGALVVTLIAFIIWPERIATLKDGTQPVVKLKGITITADDLYTNLKNQSSISVLLNDIDDKILSKLYEEDDEMDEEVKSNAEYYLNLYNQYYGYTEEEFLENNGFSSYDEFTDYLKLDYRRKQYEEDYIKDNITDKEIQEYYDENVFGDINCQHILISTSSDSDSDSDDDSTLSDDDAKALAQEIIDKLNDGTSWEDIQTEYKDKITYEDLGYQSWNASLEDSFMSALKEMKDNSFSTEPVKTSYGYHVIYRLDQKKTPTLKKSKSDIIDKLVSQKESDDENIEQKALISLRKEYNIKFSDTELKEEYEEFCKEYE